MVKSGGSGRVIVNHMCNEDGFLSGGDDIFISKKDTKSYHDNMNAQGYEECFRKVLTLVPNKSVLALDQATYHKRLVFNLCFNNTLKSRV